MKKCIFHLFIIACTFYSSSGYSEMIWDYFCDKPAPTFTVQVYDSTNNEIISTANIDIIYSDSNVKPFRAKLNKYNYYSAILPVFFPEKIKIVIENLNYVTFESKELNFNNGYFEKKCDKFNDFMFIFVP